MSYAAQPAVTAPPPTVARPPAVTSASALLWLMGAAGLCYAVATIVIAPGTVDRFRDVASGDGADNFVTVVWLDTALAVVLSILFFALFVVLGLGLRRGSRVARTVSLVICVLGVLGGLASFVTVLVQRSGDPVPGSLSDALGSAYPEGWVGLNVVVAALQVLAYLAVGAMLLVAPRTFFGHAASRPGAAFGPQFGPGHPAFGGPPGPGYSAFGTPPGPGQPFGTPPGPGQPAFGSTDFPGAFGSPVAAYGPTPTAPQGSPAAPFSAPPGMPHAMPNSPYAPHPGASYGLGAGQAAPIPAVAADGSSPASSGYAPPVQNSPYAPFGPPGFTPPVPPSADLSGYMPPTTQGFYPPVGGFPAAPGSAAPAGSAAPGSADPAGSVPPGSATPAGSAAPAGSATSAGGGGWLSGSSEAAVPTGEAGNSSVGLPTGAGSAEGAAALPQAQDGPSNHG